MTRTIKALVLALAVVAAFAVPSGAGDALTLSDACGDADSHVAVGQRSTQLEASQGYVDLGGAVIADRTGGGVNITVKTCGAIAPEDGSYVANWTFADGCSHSLGWRPSEAEEDVNLEPQIHYSERCYQQNPNGSGDQQETFNVVLPDSVAKFNGKSVTYTLTQDVVPAAAKSRLVRGAKWSGLGAIAMDSAAGAWGNSWGLGPGLDYDLRLRTDYGWTDGVFVVG